MRKPFFVLPDEYPDALNVMGDQVRVLVSPNQTNGYAITLVQGHEGDGPPPHRHAWDESFFVFEGEVEFVIDGETKVAVPGTLVHFPAGTVHSFQFGTGGAQIVEITGMGSRAIEMFTAIDREIPVDNQDGAKIAEVLRSSGVELEE